MSALFSYMRERYFPADEPCTNGQDKLVVFVLTCCAIAALAWILL